MMGQTEGVKGGLARLFGLDTGAKQSAVNYAVDALHTKLMGQREWVDVPFPDDEWDNLTVKLADLRKDKAPWDVKEQQKLKEDFEGKSNHEIFLAATTLLSEIALETTYVHYKKVSPKREQAIASQLHFLMQDWRH